MAEACNCILPWDQCCGSLRGQNCRSSCPTRDHLTWGECARAAAIQIDRHALAHSLTAEKDKDQRLTRYADARKQGLQPRSTEWRHVREAFETGGVENTIPVAR